MSLADGQSPGLVPCSFCRQDVFARFVRGALVRVAHEARCGAWCAGAQVGDADAADREELRRAKYHPNDCGCEDAAMIQRIAAIAAPPSRK